MQESRLTGALPGAQTVRREIEASELNLTARHVLRNSRATCPSSLRRPMSKRMLLASCLLPLDGQPDVDLGGNAGFTNQVDTTCGAWPPASRSAAFWPPALWFLKVT